MCVGPLRHASSYLFHSNFDRKLFGEDSLGYCISFLNQYCKSDEFLFICVFTYNVLLSQNGNSSILEPDASYLIILSVLCHEFSGYRPQSRLSSQSLEQETLGSGIARLLVPLTYCDRAMMRESLLLICWANSVPQETIQI